MQHRSLPPLLPGRSRCAPRQFQVQPVLSEAECQPDPLTRKLLNPQPHLHALEFRCINAFRNLPVRAVVFRSVTVQRCRPLPQRFLRRGVARRRFRRAEQVFPDQAELPAQVVGPAGHRDHHVLPLVHKASLAHGAVSPVPPADAPPELESVSLSPFVAFLRMPLIVSNVFPRRQLHPSFRQHLLPLPFPVLKQALTEPGNALRGKVQPESAAGYAFRGLVPFRCLNAKGRKQPGNQVVPHRLPGHFLNHAGNQIGAEGIVAEMGHHRVLHLVAQHVPRPGHRRIRRRAVGGLVQSRSHAKQGFQGDGPQHVLPSFRHFLRKDVHHAVVPPQQPFIHCESRRGAGEGFAQGIHRVHRPVAVGRHVHFPHDFAVAQHHQAVQLNRFADFFPFVQKAQNPRAGNTGFLRTAPGFKCKCLHCDAPHLLYFFSVCSR